MISVAFLFLVLSSIAEVYVPKLTGAILDSLVESQNSTVAFTTVAAEGGGALDQIPGFVRNIKLLLLVSLLSGVFGGLRFSIFSVRLRLAAREHLSYTRLLKF